MTLPANAPSAAQECIKESRPVTRGSMTPELVFAMESELKALRHEVREKPFVLPRLQKTFLGKTVALG